MANTPHDDSALAARRAGFDAAIARSKQACAESVALLARIRERNPSLRPRVSTRDAFDAFARTLETDGIRAALVYLRGLTDYRYLSIYRSRGDLARAAVHVDRDDPGATDTAEVAETATYCTFVRTSGGPFATADAPRDARLDGHPKQHALASYCGVPILTPEGELLGTLCHYDVVARDPGQLDLELLLQVASRLVQSGAIPPYPEP